MSTNSRKEAREQFAALLNTALVGVGLPVQVLYDYRIGDFDGQSPVVTVSSAGSLRTQKTFATVKPSYRFYIHIFVLYSTEDGNWTEADAQDALDDIEEIVSDTVDASRDTAYWKFLAYDGFTEIDDIEIGGKEYIREIITVRAE